jgi:PKD repeat protein
MGKGDSNDTYEGLIPSFAEGTTVDYYLTVSDLGGVELMSPLYAPYEVHSFSVMGSSAPPVADAGDDFAVEMDLEFVLDGSGSSDDVGIVNYTWTFSDGTPRTLYGVSPSCILTTPGDYEFTLTVFDGDAQSDQDGVIVHVYDPEPPVADAGEDQMVAPGEAVLFDSSSSSDNLEIVNWTWSFVYNGSDQALYGPSPSFTFWTEGVYLVTLTVADGEGNDDTDTVTIAVGQNPIPEFSNLLLPVVAIACLVIIIRARRS